MIAPLGLAAFVGAAGEKSASSSTPLSADDCFECEDCTSSNSHYDYIEIDPAWNHWRGGTFVNMCGVAYSECFDPHDLCPPICTEEPCPPPPGGGEAEQADPTGLTFAEVGEMERAFRDGDADAALRLVRQYRQWIHFDEEFKRVEIRDCRARLVATLPAGPVFDVLADE